MAHIKPHPRRGQTVPLLVNAEMHNFEIEDWWDRVSPRDDEEHGSMVYGKVNGMGKLVYESDLHPPAGETDDQN